MAQQLQDAGLATVGSLMATYDDCTDAALDELVRECASDVAGAIMEHARQATAGATATWNALRYDAHIGPLGGRDLGRSPARTGHNILPGDEDGTTSTHRPTFPAERSSHSI